MLSIAKFPPNLQSLDVFLHASSLKITTFPLSNKTQISFCSNSDSRLRLHANLQKKRYGFSLNASKNATKGEKLLPETAGFDQDDDFSEEDEEDFSEEEEEEEEEDDEEEEESFIPLLNMKNWLANKPSGFGEGKAYDTSIEDKLMEEIEQSRTAQLANVNKLKHNPISPVSKKAITQQQKDTKEQINGYKVRLLNLPTKKNIHRDLKLAFKQVPGIIEIVPVVSGNKKTRDPICKGRAFVYFKHETDAQRFVESFSGQSISFGKVQKQIKCMIDTSIPKPGNAQSSRESGLTAGKLQILDVHSLKDRTSSESDVEDEILESAHLEEIEDEDSETHEYAEFTDIDGDDEEEEEERIKFVVKSKSLKQKDGSKKDGKSGSKKKKEKGLKFNVLGSAKRLGMKEKQVLTGAFSKYGASTSLATAEPK